MEKNQIQQVQYTIDNFIGVYEKLFTKEYCDSAINFFESQVAAGFGVNRQDHDGAAKTDKDDLSVYSDAETKIYNPELFAHFNKIFWSVAYEIYSNKFSVLKQSGRHGIFEIKVQKTEISQGYHAWHYESAGKDVCDRLSTFILYLNDVEEGGETEFLYYPRRIKPTTGTLVLWPGSYTHTHRGNPPISNTKYIMTGWVEF